MIKGHASRAAFVRERGWDASTYEVRTKLLSDSREQYLVLLRELLGDDADGDEDAGGSTPASPDAE
jgi:hypothetical protein